LSIAKMGADCFGPSARADSQPMDMWVATCSLITYNRILGDPSTTTLRKGTKELGGLVGGDSVFLRIMANFRRNSLWINSLSFVPSRIFVHFGPPLENADAIHGSWQFNAWPLATLAPGSNNNQRQRVNGGNQMLKNGKKWYISLNMWHIAHSTCMLHCHSFSSQIVFLRE
jgi:hypothetical protein